jgi:two-component system response regulator PilR (NtrC family)
LHVPTLAQRLSDIPELADAILKKLAKNQNKTPIDINPECIEQLKFYHFPGNVRELENILERAMAMCDGMHIEMSDLNLPVFKEKIEIEPPEKANLTDKLCDQEKELILDALDKTKWNRTAAARLLGVSFRTLRYRLKKLGLD